MRENLPVTREVHAHRVACRTTWEAGSTCAGHGADPRSPHVARHDELRDDGATVRIVPVVGSQIVGAVVDSLSDVPAFKADDVRSLPDMTASVESRLVTGVGSLKQNGTERMLTLLDIAALLTSMQPGSVLVKQFAAA